LSEHVEVETGKGSDALERRPKLRQAVDQARKAKASVVVAKLDRLSRDPHFLLGLEKAGIDFVCVDMPNANRLTVGIMALVAGEERRMISERTKKALAEAKKRGVKLGGVRPNQPKVDPALGRAALAQASGNFAKRVGPLIAELRQPGMSFRRIETELTKRGIRSGSLIAITLRRSPPAGLQA
jgi:DNA invertase Pin-like site-specific DNA recombinase